MNRRDTLLAILALSAMQPLGAHGQPMMLPGHAQVERRARGSHQFEAYLQRG